MNKREKRLFRAYGKDSDGKATILCKPKKAAILGTSEKDENFDCAKKQLFLCTQQSFVFLLKFIRISCNHLKSSDRSDSVVFSFRSKFVYELWNQTSVNMLVQRTASMCKTAIRKMSLCRMFTRLFRVRHT